jgi:hypothetical protein
MGRLFLWKSGRVCLTSQTFYESEIQGIPAAEFTIDRAGNAGQMGRETGI